MPTTLLDLTLDELRAAATRVYAVMPPTPQFAWPKLAARTGATVWVKHENHTPTGAFKVRGGILYLEHLVRERPSITGIITATRGNHGQSIAMASARAGLSATIFVPHGNSPDQNASMRAFGAEVIENGEDFEAARRAAHALAGERGLHWIPSFHRDLVRGVASYALELFAASDPLAAVFVPVGMGSGICGLIAARDLLGLPTAIIGVCAAGAPATARSFAAGEAVTTPQARTFADGIATRAPDPAAIAAICRGAERIVEVSDEQIAEAMRVYYDDTHQVAEGAGAAALAALLGEASRWQRRTVAVILSGGNIERDRYRMVINGQTPPA